MIRLAALVALLPGLAAAQVSEGAAGVVFDFGVGVGAVPGYFGSDEATAGLALDFEFGYLGLGPFSFGDPGRAAVREGWGFRGSFRYVAARDAEEYEELAGLDDVDQAFELGGGVSYARPWWEAFAVARYGFGGHETVVADLGLDLIARPTRRLALRAGPRLFLGSDAYADTYFGVTPEEAGRIVFSAFEAEGGLLTSGIEVGADYQFTDAWGVEATARYDRFQADASESPITAEDNQVSASIVVTRRFAFGF